MSKARKLSEMISGNIIPNIGKGKLKKDVGDYKQGTLISYIFAHGTVKVSPFGSQHKYVETGEDLNTIIDNPITVDEDPDLEELNRELAKK